MRQGLGNAQRLDTGLKIDPRLVLASHLLQLNQTELEQAIETELNENPALDRLQEDVEPISEEMVFRAIAPQELKPSGDDPEFRRSLPNDEGGLSWLDLAVGEPQTTEHLRAQLLSALPAKLRKVGEYLVESLDPRGYLGEPLEEVALHCECSIEEAGLALAALQRCNPAGVGARSVQECLLLQLLRGDTLEHKLAAKIVKNYLDDFVSRKTMRIARRYGVMPDVVQRAFAEILSLNPYPCEGEPGSLAWASRSVGVCPDLVLNRAEAGWQVEVKGPDETLLKVSRAYYRRQTELNERQRPPRDEKRHVDHFVQRARDFISCVEQRRRTMRAIGEYLVVSQEGFVSTGDYAFLRPLTRSQVAEDLDLHESTVSRATADKFVQLATGEVVSFDVFFKPALRVQKMIEGILATENPTNPLSDERIAELLAEKGVIVARRTVNKYRDRTKLLSSRKRRTA